MFICGESHGVPTINGNGNGNGNVFSFGGSGIASTTVGYGIPIPFSFNLVVISIAVNTVDTVSATFVVNRYNYGSSTPDLTPLSTIVLTSPVTTVAVNSSLNNGGVLSIECTTISTIDTNIQFRCSICLQCNDELFV